MTKSNSSDHNLAIESKNQRPPTTRLSWNCPFDVVCCKDWLLNAAALHQIIGEHGWTHAILGVTGYKKQLRPVNDGRDGECVGRDPRGIMRIWTPSCFQVKSNKNGDHMYTDYYMLTVPCMVWDKSFPSWSPSAGLSCRRHRWMTAPHSCIPLKHWVKKAQMKIKWPIKQVIQRIHAYIQLWENDTLLLLKLWHVMSLTVTDPVYTMYMWWHICSWCQQIGTYRYFLFWCLATTSLLT